VAVIRHAIALAAANGVALGAAIASWGYSLFSREAVLVGVAVAMASAIVAIAVFVDWFMEDDR
jgi:ABC-type cobalamin transport system permease subunit